MVLGTYWDSDIANPFLISITNLGSLANQWAGLIYGSIRRAGCRLDFSHLLLLSGLLNLSFHLTLRQKHVSMLSWQTPPKAQSGQDWACVCSLQTLQQQHTTVESTCTTVRITPCSRGRQPVSSSWHLSIQAWIYSFLPAGHRQTIHYFKIIVLLCFWVTKPMTHTRWGDFICNTYL